MAKESMVANLRMQEREDELNKQTSTSNDQEVILNSYLRSNITPKPCSLPELHRKETITVTHAVDAF